MKAKVVAPANIAFVKYWGKVDISTRVPANSSLSMCLSNLFSESEVEFNRHLKKDTVEFVGEKVVKDKEIERIVAVLNRVRKLAKINWRAKVKTRNNFPKATGIASSASGFASVTMAAVSAAGLKLNQKEMSKLARLASGTAARSIPDGFVEWLAGTNSQNSYARQIFPPGWWRLCDVVAIVTSEMKKVSSTDGHRLADTSPFYRARMKGMKARFKQVKQLIKKRDFTAFGKSIEAEALNMHAICLTSTPSLIYWNQTTLEIMHKIRQWREEELESYFTIDAGPSVHVICREKDATRLATKLRRLTGVMRAVVNRPGIGARLLT